MIEANIITTINEMAKDNKPFLFVIDYKGEKAYIKALKDINPRECLYDFGGSWTNVAHHSMMENVSSIEWKVDTPKYQDYQRSFDIVKRNILAGNSYLTNLTCRVPIHTNLSLLDIFMASKAKYKLLIQDKFVCFSPETFIQIHEGRIFSYPMKGTIDATLPHAEDTLMKDEKEAAEHATIVDLIRNDISQVATNVRVDKYRYIDRLSTNKGDILQTSSKISGKLSDNYRLHIGDILAAQLPAGSITGAPKNKTIEIINEAELYQRGFYTGIMGIYDGQGNMDSAVMIRFVEQEENGTMVFKAGGGITSKSDCHKEYKEVIQKIYLPITQ